MVFLKADILRKINEIDENEKFLTSCTYSSNNRNHHLYTILPIEYTNTVYQRHLATLLPLINASFHPYVIEGIVKVVETEQLGEAPMSFPLIVEGVKREAHSQK